MKIIYNRILKGCPWEDDLWSMLGVGTFRNLTDMEHGTRMLYDRHQLAVL